MPKANDTPKRDLITFYINAQVRKSAASCRFIEEYRASGEHAEKRDKMLAALVAGQLIEEAGLMPVMQFLDRDSFRDLSERQRQMLLVARLQEYLGISPQSEPVAVPVATSQLGGIETEASVSPTSELNQKNDVPEGSEAQNVADDAVAADNSDAEASADNKKPVSRFAAKLPGA